MLELRRAGRPERMGGNYINYAYYPYWSSILLTLDTIRKVRNVQIILIILSDLGVADKGWVMYFLLNRLIFNCLMTTPLLIIIVIQFILC